MLRLGQAPRVNQALGQAAQLFENTWGLPITAGVDNLRGFVTKPPAKT